MAGLSDACCRLPAVKANYKPQYASIPITLDDNPIKDLSGYFIQSPSKKALVIVYDIFGFHPNAFQVCDILAQQTGFNVVMPNYFRNEKAPTAQGRDAILGFAAKFSFENGVKSDTQLTLDWLASKGIDGVGMVGFCWGGKMCFKSAAIEDWDLIKGIASAHPSFAEPTDGLHVHVPICILPSKDEDDAVMKQIMVDVEAKGFSIPSVHVRFDDMHHGWVCARGDYTIPEQRDRATLALGYFVDFFKKVLA